MTGCYSCDENELHEPAPWKSIYRDDHWRLAHSFDSALPGWLVAVPLRHITAIHELRDEEGSTLGVLVSRASAALRDVTGCEKTYVMQFAEGDGFAHVHFHIVPRMSSFTADERGPRVFSFLGREPVVPEDERNRLATALSEAIVRV